MSYTSAESEEQERKLFVGGLNKDMTDEDKLRNFFIMYGGIIDCTIMRDADKKSRGFGFVLFDNSSSVDEIMRIRKDGKNFTLDDHHIEVKRALPKVPGGTAGSSRTGGLYRKIFVGGLPSSITDEDLRKYFERFGKVTEVELLRDRETNRLRGFAFVTFDDEDSADKCIQRRTHEICKKICEVKRAQTRSNLTRDDDDYHRGGGRSYGRDRDDRSQQGPPSAPSSLGIAEVNQLIQQAFLMGQQSVMNMNNTVFEPVADAVYPISNNRVCMDQVDYHYEKESHYNRKLDGSKEYSRTSRFRKRRWDHKQSHTDYQSRHEVVSGDFLQSGVVQPPTAATLLNQINQPSYQQTNTNTQLLQALMNQQQQQPPPVQPAPAPIAQPTIQPAASNTNMLASQIAQLLQGQGPNALNALMKPDDNRPAPAKPAANGAYSTSYPAPTSTYDMYYNQSNTSSQNYGPVKDESDSKRYRPY